MIIPNEQMAVFADGAKASYQDRMVVHLKKCFPDQCGKMDEAQIRSTVDLGIEQAGPFGIVTERDVCLFVDLMFIFGPDFHVSQKLPWASEILKDPWRTNPSHKIDFLYDTALGVLKQQVRA